MKKVIIVVLSFLAGTSLFAQISLENTYNYCTSFTVVNLSISGYKYCAMDSLNYNTVKLYNMNHTIWKTINLNVPAGYKTYGPANVSETLFNSDALVEVAYTYQKISSPIDYGAKITNESGSDIFTFPIHPSVALWCVSAGSNGAKMLVYYRNSIYTTVYSYNVYSLPGQIMSNANVINSENIESNAFPNPADNNITITYSIPNGENDGNLIIYDMNGMEIRHYMVDRNFNNIYLNTSEFSSGTYLYKVVSGSGESQTKKFIIE